MNIIDVVWHEYLKSIQFQSKNNTIILKIGDCIIYKNRDLPVRIEKFVTYDNSRESKPDPLGFEYLPWRGDRWATPLFGLRGNPRFIICPPSGLPHYGQHIDWDSIQIVDNPNRS